MKQTHSVRRRLARAVLCVAIMIMMALPVQAQILVSGHVTCWHGEQEGSWPESSCVFGQSFPADFDKGNYVRSIQGMMNRFGYHVHGLAFTVASCPSTYSAVVTGTFASCTTGAVQNFQYYHLIDADGIVGPQTWEYMQAGNVKGGMGPVLPLHSSSAGCREGWNATRTAMYQGSCAFSASHHSRPYSADYRTGDQYFPPPYAADSDYIWTFWHNSSSCYTRVWLSNTGNCQ